MAISTCQGHQESTLIIKIKGRFDFSSHQNFRDAYEHSNDVVKEYIVDMDDTAYLDSSALGMLLLLRDHAGGDASNISIINCNTSVRKILTISNFEQLFVIQ
jgi:anti-anti-sigma factor